VSTDLITIPGRILDLPRLYYGPEKSQVITSGLQAAQLRELTTRNRELSSWNLEHVTFARPSNIGKLHVLALKESRRSLPDAQLVRNNMVATLQSHNMSLTAGEYNLQDGTQLNDKLATWYSESHVDANDCTLVLLKQKDLLIYSQVRRQADLESGKHTICALGSKIDNAQTRSNLALKVNMKGAGDNHHLDEAVLNKLLGSERRKRTMILGADVTHSGAGTKSGSPSIACVVGSVDKHFMNYPGSMRLQAGGQEVSHDSRHMTKQQLTVETANSQRTPSVHGQGTRPRTYRQHREQGDADLHALLQRWCVRVSVQHVQGRRDSRNLRRLSTGRRRRYKAKPHFRNHW